LVGYRFFIEIKKPPGNQRLKLQYLGRGHSAGVADESSSAEKAAMIPRSHKLVDTLFRKLEMLPDLIERVDTGHETNWLLRYREHAG